MTRFSSSQGGRASQKRAPTADDADVFASHVSLWEMAIKAGQGRLDVLDRSAVDGFEHYIPASGLKVVQIWAEQTAATESLPELHRDPFDRLLVTQAVTASLEFAAFVAMRPINELTTEEIETVTGLLHARREPNGVPLIWDVVVVEAD